MQSAAKAPFLATFKVKQCEVGNCREWAFNPQKSFPGLLFPFFFIIVFPIFSTQKNKFLQVTEMQEFDLSKVDLKVGVSSKSCIFKEGDDLRQDILALQIIDFSLKVHLKMKYSLLVDLTRRSDDCFIIS